MYIYICVCVAKKKIAEKDYVPEISHFPANLSIAACFRSLLQIHFYILGGGYLIGTIRIYTQL